MVARFLVRITKRSFVQINMLQSYIPSINKKRHSSLYLPPEAVSLSSKEFGINFNSLAAHISNSLITIIVCAMRIRSIGAYSMSSLDQHYRNQQNNLNSTPAIIKVSNLSISGFYEIRTAK